MRLLAHLLCLCSLLATGPSVYSQPSDTLRDPFFVGGGLFYGFIIPHSPDIEALADAYPRGLTVEAGWTLTRENAWQYCRCFPRLGVMANYLNLNNPAELGQGVGALVFLEPLLAAERRFSLSFRGGMGGVYLSQPFDAETNPRNLFYSTRVSVLLQAQVAARYRLTPDWNIRLGVNYFHISNGGWQEPNKGINYPTLSLGADFSPQRGIFPRYQRGTLDEQYPRRTYGEAALLLSGQTIGEASRRYPLVGLYGGVARVVGRLSALTGGLEWVADGSLRERLRREGQATSFHRVALLVGHDLLIGRFVLGVQAGPYLYAPAPARDPIYQRYNVRWRFGQHWAAGVSLKTHRQVADFFDLRLIRQF